MSNYNNNPYAQQQQPPPQSPYYQYPQDQGQHQQQQEQPFPAPGYVQYVQPAATGVAGQPQPQQQYYYVEQQPQQQVYYDYSGQQQQPLQQVAPAQMPMPMPMPFPQSPLPQQQQQMPLQMPTPAVMPQPAAVIPTPVSPIPAAIPQPAALPIPAQSTAGSSIAGPMAPVQNQPSGDDGSAVVAFAPSKFDDGKADSAVVGFKPSAFDPTEASTPTSVPAQHLGVATPPVAAHRPPSPTPSPVPAPAPAQDNSVASALPAGSLAPDRPWYQQKKWQISLTTFACSFIVALCSILGHTRFIQAVNDTQFPAPQVTKELTAKSIVFLDLIGVLASIISLTVVARFSMVKPGTIIPLLFHRAVAIMAAAMTVLLLIATTLLFVSGTSSAYSTVCDPTPLGGLFQITADRFATACGAWRACIFFGYAGVVAWVGLAIKSYTKWVSMRVEKK